MLQLAACNELYHNLIEFAFKGYNHFGGYIVFAFTKSLEANCGQVVADFAKMVCYGAVLVEDGIFFLKRVALYFIFWIDKEEKLGYNRKRQIIIKSCLLKHSMGIVFLW